MTTEMNGSGIGKRFPNPTASSVGGSADQYINQLLSGSLDGGYETADKFEKKQGEAKHGEATSPWKTAGKWLVYGLAVVGAWRMGRGTIVKTAFNSIFRREEGAGFRSLFQGWGRKGERVAEREGSILSKEKRADIDGWRRKTTSDSSPGSSVIDAHEPIHLFDQEAAEREAARNSMASNSIKATESEAGKGERRSSIATTEEGDLAGGQLTPGSKLTPQSSSKASSVADDTPAIPTESVSGAPVRTLDDVMKTASATDKEFLQQGVTRYKNASASLQKTKAAHAELQAKQESAILDSKDRSALIAYEKLISKHEMELEELTDIASKSGISKAELEHWSGVTKTPGSFKTASNAEERAEMSTAIEKASPKTDDIADEEITRSAADIERFQSGKDKKANSLNGFDAEGLNGEVMSHLDNTDFRTGLPK